MRDGRRADRRVPARRHPARFAWREPPYEYEHDKLPIDILSGSDRLRRGDRRRRRRRRARRDWTADEEAFRELRQQFLLY